MPRPRTPEFTTKQRKLAALLAGGFTLSEAAEKIGIPYKTADGYRGIIYGKLRIHSRPELTAWAIITGSAPMAHKLRLFSSRSYPSQKRLRRRLRAETVESEVAA